MNIFVAGHKGMVGSALVKHLELQGHDKIITAKRNELDLLNQEAVRIFFECNKIDQVYLAAAKVGGIHANNEYPADFIYQNLMIQTNVVNASHCADIDKLLFLGSSCIYPKFSSQPIKEESLLTGVLEQTNEPYAIAKIAGIKLCESYNRQYGRDYRSVMPTNLYGPNDNFHPVNSHVIPGMIHRFHDAILNNKKEIAIWGSGNPKREFLHVDDMASGSFHVMNLDKNKYSLHTLPMLSHVNIGSGIDCSIKELAETIAEISGYKGKLTFDKTKQDGAPQKLMDNSRMRLLGWKPSINLKNGIENTYKWFKDNIDLIRMN